MAKLYVVGLGPGDYDNMTVRADRALQSCDCIVGYHVYVDLVKDRYPDKRTLTTPMTKEADRCRMALEAARRSKFSPDPTAPEEQKGSITYTFVQNR